MELVVDTQDTYEPDSNLFYLPGPHISMLKCVRPNQFESARIINTDVDYLTSYALANLYSTLKEGATVSITISQPVAVMQEYDAKQVEANARLAGFNDIQMNSTSYTDPKSGREIGTTEVVLTKTNRENEFRSKQKVEVSYKQVSSSKGGRQQQSGGSRRRK